MNGSLVLLVIVFLGGFVFGLLFGRKNPSEAALAAYGINVGWEKAEGLFARLWRRIAG